VGSLLPLEESTDDPPCEQSLARLDISAVLFVIVVVENSSNDPPHEQWLARLDVGALSFGFVVVVVSVVVEYSINDPPREQWLARLDVGAGLLLSLFVVGQPSHPSLKTHPTSSGS
jgi:hypothetical protein